MIPSKPPPTFKNPEKWSKSLKDFLTQCVVKNPEERATATSLLQVGRQKKVRMEVWTCRKCLFGWWSPGCVREGRFYNIAADTYQFRHAWTIERLSEKNMKHYLDHSWRSYRVSLTQISIWLSVSFAFLFLSASIHQRRQAIVLAQDHDWRRHGADEGAEAWQRGNL